MKRAGKPAPDLRRERIEDHDSINKINKDMGKLLSD